MASKWIRPAALIAYGAALCTVLASFFARSLQSSLWLDDQYTLAEVGAKDLAQLFRAVPTGMDMNPPLYMTMGWFAVHEVAPWAPPEMVLRALGALLMVLTLVVIYRILRRFLSEVGAFTAVVLFLAWDIGLAKTALELRDYALYLLLTATTLLFVLRAAESRSRRDRILVAVFACALTLSHTFGVVYACCIAAGAALVGAVRKDRELLVTAGVTAAPALLVFGLWLPFLLGMARLGRPYGWIVEPLGEDLRNTIFPTTKVALIGAAMFAYVAVSHRRLRSGEGFWRASDGRLAIATLALSLFALFTIAVFFLSKLVYPLFVTRYFAPDLLIAAAIAALFVDRLFRALPQPWMRNAVAVGVAGASLTVYVVTEPLTPYRIPCFNDSTQTFLEQLAPPEELTGLPIVTESPHAWFPRNHDLPGRYLYALDWDVVLKYPRRSTNNATDFNIMERFRDWSGAKGILTTAEILQGYPEFLVLDEPSRAWLLNLLTTRHVAAKRVGRAGACELWRVRAR
jgi:hypothetical protein